jgi:hypothetical protein
MFVSSVGCQYKSKAWTRTKSDVTRVCGGLEIREGAPLEAFQKNS